MLADIFDTALKNSGTGLFVNLKDGDSAEGVFMGEPMIFYQNFKTKEVSTEPKEEFSFKFKINFAVRKPDGTFEMKILQGPKAMAKDMVTVLKEYGDMNMFKVLRQGSDKKTSYSVMLSKNQLTDNDKLLLKGCKLHDLGKGLPF